MKFRESILSFVEVKRKDFVVIVCRGFRMSGLRADFFQWLR